MRPIDADELIKERDDNDPVVIAAANAPTVEPDLPATPIECAEMLIFASYECEDVMRAFLGYEGIKERKRYYHVDELRQIAEHLIVYCNHAEDDDG